MIICKEYDVIFVGKGSEDFDILNQLNDEELAVGKPRNKSVGTYARWDRTCQTTCQKYNINIKQVMA